MTQRLTPADIINFWHTPPMSEHWFSSTAEIDDSIHTQFAGIWEQAAQGKLNDWQDSAEGCLALCIILDQLPLNMFRGEAKSFSTEQQAVAVCKHAVREGLDQQLTQERLMFLYMPLMHSEHMADQDESVRLFTAAGLERNADFAKHHRDIVERFGRFPHRNAILNRESSVEELAYLESDEAFAG